MEVSLDHDVLDASSGRKRGRGCARKLGKTGRGGLQLLFSDQAGGLPPEGPEEAGSMVRPARRAHKVSGIANRSHAAWTRCREASDRGGPVEEEA